MWFASIVGYEFRSIVQFKLEYNRNISVSGSSQHHFGNTYSNWYLIYGVLPFVLLCSNLSKISSVYSARPFQYAYVTGKNIEVYTVLPYVVKTQQEYSV